MRTLLYGIEAWGLGMRVSILKFFSEGYDDRDSGLGVPGVGVPRLDLKKLSGTKCDGRCWQILLLLLSQGP